MATLFVDAPDSLLIAWNRLALRGVIDGQTPPPTVQEVYDQGVEIQVRELRAAMQAIEEDVEAFRAEQEPAQARDRVVCAVCGARQVEHFYTSKRDGRTVCAACYQPHPCDTR